MSEGTTIEEGQTILDSRVRDDLDIDHDGDQDVMVFHLNGPWFFGAAARLGALLDQVSERPRAFTIDFANVPFIFSSGAHSFALLACRTARKDGQLLIAGARPEVRIALHRAGVHSGNARFLPNLSALRRSLANRPTRKANRPCQSPLEGDPAPRRSLFARQWTGGNALLPVGANGEMPPITKP